MSKCSINGKEYDIPNGSSISVRGNKVFVDGVELAEADKLPEINVTVTGDLGSLQVMSANLVMVRGNVNGPLTSESGDLDIKGNVTGDVRTDSGDVSVGGTVGGSVRTDSGDIVSRKK